jgi:hypothetical protein
MGISPNHLAGCASVWTPDDALHLADAYRIAAAEPTADARGRVYESQHGELMTLAQHMEAATGQRLLRDGDGLFESGRPRREVTVPHREMVVSDPDDPDARPQPFSWGTRETAAAAMAQMGLTPATASRERDRYRAQRDAAISRLALSRPARLPHPDWGESTRERAARLNSAVVPVQVNDPVMGSLPAYAAG